MASQGAGSAIIEVVAASIESNRIKQFLAKLGLSQERFARCVGISFRHMHRIITGQADPSYLLACRIGAVLQQPVDRVFRGKIRTRRLPRGTSDAEVARVKAAVSARQRAAAYKAWATRRANDAR
jgi:DNA-binding XRE family transcriptional regulator